MENGLEFYGKIEELLMNREAGIKLWGRYLEILEEKGIRQVLDIGCGSGEFCKLAEKRGIKVVGIDLSRTQISRALKKGCNCILQKVEEMEGRFDGAVAIFDVVNYLSPRQLPHFFQAVAKLTPLFIFDINSHYGMSEVAVGALKIDKQEGFLCVESNYDKGRLITEFTLFTPAFDHLYRREEGKVVQYFHRLERVTSILPFQGVEVEPVTLYGSPLPEKWLIIGENPKVEFKK
jgi:SAM-dependent methyltransferase